MSELNQSRLITSMMFQLWSICDEHNLLINTIQFSSEFKCKILYSALSCISVDESLYKSNKLSEKRTCNLIIERKVS